MVTTPIYTIKFIGKLSIVVGFDMNNGIFSFGVALFEKETNNNKKLDIVIYSNRQYITGGYIYNEIDIWLLKSP